MEIEEKETPKKPKTVKILLIIIAIMTVVIIAQSDIFGYSKGQSSICIEYNLNVFDFKEDIGYTSKP